MYFPLTLLAFLGPVDLAWAEMPLHAVPEGPRVWVLEVEDGGAEQLAAHLSRIHPDWHVLAGGPWVEVIGPLDPGALEGLDGVTRVREPWPLSHKRTESEALDEILVPVDWAAQGLTGDGVTVGILDLGFAGLDDLLGEELPAVVEVWEDGVGAGISHGTAVAEIVHDVAPGATLRVYPFQSEVSFIAALEAAEQDGVDVINASIGFDNVWHADGSSPVSQAVDQAADAGMLYVAAAGNEIGRYRIGALTDSDGDGWLELDGDERVSLVKIAGEISASLRWSEPFGEAETDLELVLFNAVGECARSEQDSQDPYVSVACSEGTSMEAGIWLASGELPETGWLYAPYGVQDSYSEAGTLTLPADAAGAFAVGALRLGEDEAPVYSSQGPTDDGRIKPDIAAPSGVSTASYGLLNFSGTSAAAPHVTGVAALLAEHMRRARPEELTAALVDMAQDVGEPGVDNVSGAGRVQTGALPERCGCSSRPGGGSMGGAAILGLWLLGRRRRGRSSGRSRDQG
ncbi:MAG: S8 family serine peptidase [Myxococcota bacterium]|nr:S8 family serine peptidase [Myxococcota bacterium]